MEETTGNAAYTYTENIFSKQGYSKVVSKRILAGDNRVNLCCRNAEKNGKIQQGNAKVMIVGEHGVGKTSLRKHLMGLQFQPEEISTESVEMFNIETNQIDKNWKGIPKDCNEHKRALYACAAYEYRQLPENPTLSEQEIKVQTKKLVVNEELASKNDNARNDSKFKSASTSMKIPLISFPFFFLFCGFPGNFAMLHLIYVMLYCFQFKDLSISHGYRFGQAAAIGYFLLQNVATHWGIIEGVQSFSFFESLRAIIVTGFFGIACGILIGSGCRHGLALACALAFYPRNHMYLTSLPNMWHNFSTQRLMQFSTIFIGTVLGGGVYHIKEYNFNIVKNIIILSFIVFPLLHFCDWDISIELFLRLEVLKNSTNSFSMYFFRLVCGIIFGAFFLTGVINYGRKIITYTDKTYHLTRMALGFLFGILLAWFTGADFSYTQIHLVDIILAVFPTIVFEIHGFLQVYNHQLDISEFSQSLQRLERQAEIVPLRIHLVDFAGDKEYHTSHQAFFAKGAIYIVVFNLENSICDKEKALDKIKYWLNSILTYVGTQQFVFLVGTHKDKVDDKDTRFFQKWLSSKICETVYYRQFNFVFPKDDPKNDVFFAVKNPVKLSKDAEAQMLRNSISQLAVSSIIENNVKPMNLNPIPLSWFHLLDNTRMLRSEGKNFIKKNELFKLLKQNSQLTEEEFVDMLKYFSNRGDIRYDDSCDSLKDVVVLHSQLFRDSIVTLVNKSMELHSGTELYSKGIVTTDIIDAAFRTDKNEERQVLRDLLEANDLILPLRTSDGKTDYMLSGFLPEYNSCDDNPKMKPTKNVYYFDFCSFLPEKLFLKLIVKCKENSKETDEHKDPVYKPVIYRNAASFIQQCGKNEIPYNICMTQKSTSQNLIQICIGAVSSALQYHMLEKLNSWVRDIVKHHNPEPCYHLGFQCAFDGACVHKEGENHMHLYQLADKYDFMQGKHVTLVCQCTGDTVEMDILLVQENAHCHESSPSNSESPATNSKSSCLSRTPSRHSFATTRSLSCQGLISTSTLIKDIPEGLVQIISEMLNTHLSNRDWTGLAAELGMSHNDVEMYRTKSSPCGELLRYWGSCTRDNIQDFLDIMRRLERLDVYDEVLAWINQQTPGKDSMNSK